MTLSLPVSCPKPRPYALVKADRHAKLKAKDEAENRKVQARSGGICEVLFVGTYGTVRCWGKKMPGVHHLIGGSGRRNVGPSILAERKLAVCKKCHPEITRHILVPVPGCDRERAATVRYQRVR